MRCLLMALFFFSKVNAFQTAYLFPHHHKPIGQLDILPESTPVLFLPTYSTNMLHLMALGKTTIMLLSKKPYKRNQESEQMPGACVWSSLGLSLVVRANKKPQVTCSGPWGRRPSLGVSSFCCEQSLGTPHPSLPTTSLYSKPTESWSAHQTVKDSQHISRAISFLRKKCAGSQQVQGGGGREQGPAAEEQSWASRARRGCVPLQRACPGNVCSLNPVTKVFDVGTYNCVGKCILLTFMFV